VAISRRIARLAACAVAITMVSAGAIAQSALTPDQAKYRPRRPNLDDTPIELIPVQGSVYLISTGKSSNISAQIDDEGVILVDAARADASNDVLAQIRKLTKLPIRAIIDTTTDLDHIGGNDALAQTGTSLYQGAPGSSPQAQVFAHEKALRRISAPTGRASAVPPELWPTDTFAGAKEKLYFNHEPIEMQWAPGHTDGDAIVWFRRSDVIATGDAFTTTSYPRFDRGRGGTMQGVLDVLNHVIDLAVAEFNGQGGTRIVPGHGRICNQADVVEYRDMATIVRDRVRDLTKAGRTLDQIKAAHVTLDYDGVYATPDYTGEMFVEAIYRDLLNPAAPSPK
jgi:glyoxylase-like metal-dependent hydrolase (beta-lactamase superfamily II)